MSVQIPFQPKRCANIIGTGSNSFLQGYARTNKTRCKTEFGDE